MLKSITDKLKTLKDNKIIIEEKQNKKQLCSLSDKLYRINKNIIKLELKEQELIQKEQKQLKKEGKEKKQDGKIIQKEIDYDLIKNFINENYTNEDIMKYSGKAKIQYRVILIDLKNAYNKKYENIDYIKSVKDVGKRLKINKIKYRRTDGNYILSEYTNKIQLTFL
jgi:hypothetical protein